MTFAIAEKTLTSAVASAGTFTVDYPSGTSSGDFADYGHEMWSAGHQTLYTQNAGDISLSFGASNVTVTYNASTSLPVDKRVSVQMNKRGADDRDPNTIRGMERIAQAPVFRVDLGSPDTADSDGVAASQSVAAAAAFVINGALASGGVATFDVPRNVVAAWTTTSILTITGKDEYGNSVVETTASGTSHTGKKAFKSISSVTSSASITSATIGTGVVLGLPVYISTLEDIVEQREDEVRIGGGDRFFLNADSPALSSASQVYAVSPVAGIIKAVTAVTNTAVTTADSAITVKTAGGTVGTITIATSGSAVGTVDTIDAIANAEILASGTVEFENDAAPGAGAASFTVEIQPISGTFVTGVQTAASGTTGDVRGTYSPATTPDGATAFSMLVSLADPLYKGATQYSG